MARLPVVGGDAGSWGAILNEFLGVSHNSDGTLKQTAFPLDTDNTLSASSDSLVPTQRAVKQYVDAGLSFRESVISTGTTTQYWRGDKTWQTLDKAAIGLTNVDNTSDADKPVSTAVANYVNNAAAPIRSISA